MEYDNVHLSSQTSSSSYQPSTSTSTLTRFPKASMKTGHLGSRKKSSYVQVDSPDSRAVGNNKRGVDDPIDRKRGQSSRSGEARHGVQGGERKDKGREVFGSQDSGSGILPSRLVNSPSKLSSTVDPTPRKAVTYKGKLTNKTSTIDLDSSSSDSETPKPRKRRTELLLSSNKSSPVKDNSSHFRDNGRAASGRMVKKVSKVNSGHESDDAITLFPNPSYKKTVNISSSSSKCESPWESSKPPLRGDNESERSRGLRYTASSDIGLGGSTSSRKRSISPPIRDPKRRNVQEPTGDGIETSKGNGLRIKGKGKENDKVSAKAFDKPSPSTSKVGGKPEETAQKGKPKRTKPLTEGDIFFASLQNECSQPTDSQESPPIARSSIEKGASINQKEADIFFSGVQEDASSQESLSVGKSTRTKKETKRKVNNEAEDFFAEVQEHEKAEAKRKEGIMRSVLPRKEDHESRGLVEKVDALSHALKGMEDEGGGLSKEDEEYCAAFRHPTKICPYCSDPLPLSPSDHLTAQALHLKAISTPAPTSTNPQARSLRYEQYALYCLQHHHEITTIPLGIRDGYRDDIDFEDIPRRLNSGWIGREIGKIVGRPEGCSIWKEALGIRKLMERGVMDVGTESRAGYYGDLGAQIIRNYFRHLHKIGSLPVCGAMSDNNGRLPMTVENYINLVLLPESITLLLMGDLGYKPSRSEQSSQGDDESRKTEMREKKRLMRERAGILCRDSAEYGRWKFRDEGDIAEETLVRVERVLESRPWSLNVVSKDERRRRKEKRKEVIVISDDESQITVGSSRRDEEDELGPDSIELMDTANKVGKRRTRDDMDDPQIKRSPDDDDPYDEFWLSDDVLSGLPMDY